MRRTFASELYNRMLSNNDIYVLTGDVGYGMFDKIRDNFPNRYINCGASEQAMVSIAVGLTLEGKICFAYSITPFILYRPFEIIRNYINHEKIPVKLIGSGRNVDYTNDGISHWSHDDKQVMGLFKNINSIWPETKEKIPTYIDIIINTNEPFYLNLKR